MMIPYEEAYQIVIDSANVLGTETKPLIDAVGCILAQDVPADMNMPPFNKSAVDGYACRKADLGSEMKLVETIAAGQIPSLSIGKGQCAKIMTGAMVPEGADTVIMVEQTEKITENLIRFTGEKTSPNICFLAEDISAGQVVLKKGTLLRAQELAVLASFGYTNPLVYRKPLISVISTGNELVEPEITPDRAQIRNSNATQTIAQIRTIGAEFEYFGIAKDTEADTRQKLEEAFAHADIVLLSGGVSMGEFDYVPKVLQELGVNILFKSIAVQPGRPTVFGVRNHQYIFGLPGNPVSSFVQFELLVKPLIYHLMGHSFKPGMLNLPMGQSYNRQKSNRKTLLPVEIREGKVFPVNYHGSAHIHSYVAANGIVALEIGKTTLKTGEMIDVRQL